MAWQRSQKNVEQRTLVDLMVTYACLGDDEKALSATEHLQTLFYSSDGHNPKKGVCAKMRTTLAVRTRNLLRDGADKP